MFEAYKIGVILELTNNITGPLKIIQKEADKTGEILKKAFMLQMAGSQLKSVGEAGIGFMRGLVEAGAEYNHQLNIMNMAGMTHLEILQATAAAWKVSGQIKTTTPTGNLKTLLDLRNVFGSTKEAIQYLPEISMIGTVLASSGNASVRNLNPDDIAFAIAKAMDVRGAVFNARQFNEQADMMTKVIIATQGRITPEAYRMLFKYGRQAIPSLSNEFLYQELPTFMLEMLGAKGGTGGRGGFGTAIAAFQRFFVQGVMSKSAMAGLQSLGLLGANVGIQTTTQGTVLLPGEHVKGIALAASDPFQYVQKVLLPAIYAKYGTNLTKSQLDMIISSSLKGMSSTGLFAVTQFANKIANVLRDQLIIQKTMNTPQAYEAAMRNDPNVIGLAFISQWQRLQTAFGKTVIPVILPAMMKLTDALTAFGNFFRSHQNMAKIIIVVVSALSGLAIILGTVALIAGSILILGAALGGLGIAALITGITAAFTIMGGILFAFWDKAKMILKDIANDIPGLSLAANAYHDVKGFVTPSKHESSIGQNEHTVAQAHTSATAQQAHVYLDKRRVGSVLFGTSMDSFFFGEGLNNMSRFNTAMSPMTPASPHAFS